MRYSLFNKSGKQLATGKTAKQIVIPLNARLSSPVDVGAISYICETKGKYTIGGYTIKLDKNIKPEEPTKRIYTKYKLVGRTGKTYRNLSGGVASKRLKCSPSRLRNNLKTGKFPFKHRSYTVYIDNGGNDIVEKGTKTKTKTKTSSNVDILYTCITPGGNFYFTKTISELSELLMIPDDAVNALFEKYQVPLSFNDYQIFNAKSFNELIAKRESPTVVDIGKLYCTYDNNSKEECLFITLDELSKIVDTGTVNKLHISYGYPVSIGDVNICDWETYWNIDYAFYGEKS